MTMVEIKRFAKQRGVSAGKLNKANLIRAIQLAERNSDCFATIQVKDCNQVNCLWLDDCSAAGA